MKKSLPYYTFVILMLILRSIFAEEIQAPEDNAPTIGQDLIELALEKDEDLGFKRIKDIKERINKLEEGKVKTQALLDLESYTDVFYTCSIYEKAIKRLRNDLLKAVVEIESVNNESVKFKGIDERHKVGTRICDYIIVKIENGKVYVKVHYMTRKFILPIN